MNPKAPRKKEPFSYPASRHVMNDTGHWIMCIPVVNNSHITKQDHDILELPSIIGVNFLTASLECGWIVSLGVVDHEGLEGLVAAGFSEQFVNLLQIFSDAGYRFLRLDADGDVLNLPTFDW